MNINKLENKQDFRELFENLHVQIFRYIYVRIGYHRETAEDLTQQVFMKAWKKRTSFNPARSSLRNWIFIIARNGTIDLYRTQKSNKEVDPEKINGIADRSENSIESDMMIEAVKRGLQKMNAHDQEVIVLRYMDDLDINSIAAIIGKKPTATKVMIHRAVMNESDIIETISSFKPEPGEKFRSDFLGLLHNLDESVTNSPQHRTRFLDSFKFSLLSVMNTKLSTTAVVAVIAIVLLGGAGTTYASDSAAPGDFLFPIDKAVEGVQRVFTFSAVSKSEFELEVMEERVLELEEVSDGDSSDAVADAIDEVEGQQLRIREQLRIMDEPGK